MNAAKKTIPEAVAGVSERMFHRIAFYPTGWSNFDSIEPCPTGPGKSCWGCRNNHPFCDENGGGAIHPRAKAKPSTTNSRRKLHLQPMMSTLLIGGVPAGEIPPSEEYPWNTIQWESAENMPTRRRVSIEEFEADMRAAGVRK